MVSTDTVRQAARLYDCGANRNRIMTAATAARTSAATLQWENGTQWDNFPELGSIYTQEYKVLNEDEGYYRVSFIVEDGRRTGLLFVDVESHDCDGYAHTTHYCLGQFYTNQGAIKFAQFAFEHFIETETWSVCPSFEPVDYIDGEPYTLRGEEIVSELFYS